MDVRIGVEPEEKELGKYRIEDSLLLFFDFFTRAISLGFFFGLVIYVTLAVLFALDGSLDYFVRYSLVLFLPLILFLFLAIIIPASLINWSIFKGKSFVSLRENSILIYMVGYKKEWLKNRIPLENIESARKLNRDEIKKIEKNSILHRFRITPRPKKPGNGFYHIVSKPKNLIKIRLHHKVPVYNFYKHSFDNEESGLGYVEGLYTADNTLIADASERHEGSLSLYYKGIEHRDIGPAIRGYIIPEIYVAIEKRDRDRFLRDLNGMIEDNEPIRPDYNLNRILGLLRFKEGWEEVDPLMEQGSDVE